MKQYGIEPDIVDEFIVAPSEYCYYLYYPVKMPGSGFKYEQRLRPYIKLAIAAMGHEINVQGGNDAHGRLYNSYIYLTVRHQMFPAGLNHNRPGWHSDGYGTDDINYIYYDNTPTEFCIQEYKDVPEHDSLSLEYFEKESKIENIKTYPCNTLLRLDERHIHRVAVKQEAGSRLFVKISFSDKEYRLKGNTHNYLFDYDWSLAERKPYRNTP